MKVEVHGHPRALILKGSRGGEFPVGSLKGSNLPEHRCEAALCVSGSHHNGAADLPLPWTQHE